MEEGLIEWMKNGPRTKSGYVAMIGVYFLLGFVGLLVGGEGVAFSGFAIGLYQTYKMKDKTFPRKL